MVRRSVYSGAVISPGLAYEVAFRPHRLAAAHAHRDLLAWVVDLPGATADPGFWKAVETAGGISETECRIAADEFADLADRARDGGFELLPPPVSEAGWPFWLADLAARARPLLSDPHVALAFEAGMAAGGLRAGWARVQSLAFLRASAPDQPDLAREAARYVTELPAIGDRLRDVLARTGRPLVAAKSDSLRDWLARAPRPDATSSPGWDSAYAHLDWWAGTLDLILAAVGGALDVPLDPVPAGDPGPEERRAMAYVLACPHADGPRLRIAELAGARRDPRAELIRLQFEIRDLKARGELPGRQPYRVQQLIGAHPEWTAPLTVMGARDVEFDRGFPWHVTIDATTFLEHAAELFALAPIGSVRLTGGLDGRGALLAARPELARLTALNLSEQGVTDADLTALTRSYYLRELRVLRLDRNKITGRGVDALAGSWELPALARVSLAFNPCDDPVDGLEYIDEIRRIRVPTEAGRALEREHGHVRWLHPDDGD